MHFSYGQVSRPAHSLDRRSSESSARLAAPGDLRSGQWTGRETAPQHGPLHNMDRSTTWGIIARTRPLHIVLTTRLP